MFGRASGKSKLLKTHDDAGCKLLRCARGNKRACCKDVRAMNFAPSFQGAGAEEVVHNQHS